MNNVIVLFLSVSLLLPVSACSSSPQQISGSALANLTEKNRVTVKQFVEEFYIQRNTRKAFETYVVADYIQHNPNILDGREAAITALEPMFNSAAFYTDIKRIVVDGDIAIIHLHAKSSPTARGGSVIDMYRLENGKIVEHWDVLQEIPANAKNPRAMF